MDDASGDRSYYSRPSGNPNTRHPISSFQQQQLAQDLELAPADLVSSPRLQLSPDQLTQRPLWCGE